MKFRTTLVVFFVFLVLLIFIFIFESKSSKNRESQDLLVDVPTADIESVVFDNGTEKIAFQRQEGNGSWAIIQPLAAEADGWEVDRLAGDFARLRFERIVEDEVSDLKNYGFPNQQVDLTVKGRPEPIRILIGAENPLDHSFFVKREDENRVVLISSTHKSLLEKKLFDFRKKDVFDFEVGEAESLELRRGTSGWKASKSDEEWFLTDPVQALAQKGRVNGILASVSGLRATEFAAEDKSPEILSRYGLDHPDFEVSVEIPAKSQSITVSISKSGDSAYAVSSLSSIVIKTDAATLDELKADAGEIRENHPVVFFMWEVERLSIRRGETSAVFVKTDESAWHFGSESGPQADMNKIEDLLRKLENLQSVEFIDPPLELSRFGLEPPQTELTLAVRTGDDAREVTLLVGTPDQEARQVVVKNSRFDYLFRVPAEFLNAIPEDAKDWELTSEENGLTKETAPSPDKSPLP